MQTSLKTLTNIQTWRLAAITIGGALAMSLATTAFAAAKPGITSSTTATGQVGVSYTASSPLYQITATNSPTSYSTTVSIPGVSFHSTTGAFPGTPTAAGTYNGNITATNANGTGTKTLSVTIAPQPHTFPTAIAAISPPAVYTGDTVTLDASASDTNPPGGTLTYVWQQTAPGSPTISLAPNNKAVIATFAAPAPPGGQDSQVVTFKVKVTDKDAPTQQQNSESAPVSTTVYALPTANAGPDQAVDQGTVVMVNGGNATGVSLTYAWAAPAEITFLDTNTQTTNAVNPTFMAPPFTPPNGMSYTFTLVVTEQRPNLPPKNSLPDQVVIMVKQPPIALASLVNDIK